MATDARLPIWMRPEPGTRRPRFTRDRIAATALAIADADGFEAVSMRRVAAELGAGTMTLYHYVSTKDDLLALMDDAIMAEVLLPDEALPRDDWRTATGMIARSSRDAFFRHPWAMEGLRGGRFGPNGMRHFEQSLIAMEATGLPPRERLSLVATVDDYVFGFVTREVGDTPERTTGEGGEWDDAAAFDYLDEMVSGGDFPAIRRLLGDDDRRAAWAEVSAGWSDRFEHGLALLLDGIELMLERRRDSG
ncbi:MAG TPA: TetR/AcrR family transcriptional regulator [Conexibacter sp.]|nr:TetR/AcrR family transcriptional regulator [Conexibacter sp.]